MVERVADASEHRRGTSRAEAPGGLLLATDRGKLAEQRLLWWVEPGRGLDEDRDDEVATTAAQPGHTASAERVLAAGLRACLDVELEGGLHAGARTRLQVGLERREGHGGPEGSSGHRHGHRAVQGGAVAREDVVLGHVHLDVEVSRGATAGTDLPLAGELYPSAGVDAGGDLHGDRATGPDPAVSRALTARIGDQGAEAATRRARTQGADLAEEGPLHLGHLTGATAGLARHRMGARGGALAVARRTDDRGVDLELARDAERRLRQRHLHAEQGVLAAVDPWTRPAALRSGLATEERIHDVGERE